MRANLGGFVSALAARGIGPRALRDRAVREQRRLAESTLAQIRGLAEGAGEPYSLLLAYNLYGELAAADGCTVMAALGSASATGRTLLMKNSDQLGNDSMVGPGYHLHKDIYVVQATRAANGRRIVGLSAAGATGIKVGVNDCGVAAGSNIARTSELAARKTDVSQVRASDRTQLLREGLEEETAVAAAQRILAKTMEAPTSTPGNMEFADAAEAWVLETSYDRFACDVTRDGPLVRTNRFQTLEYLNDPGDVSSVERYARCSALLEAAAANGGVSFDDLVAASGDHANGPGESSICRHGDDYHEETSLGAGVVEIDPAAARALADRAGARQAVPCLAEPGEPHRAHRRRRARRHPGGVPRRLGLARLLQRGARTRRRSSAEARTDEPRAPARRAMTEVGRPIPMREARQRVTGSLPFAVNVRVPGMLHGKIVRSTCAHGVIRRLDVSAAAQSAGVVGVLVGGDLIGAEIESHYGPVIPDRPLLAIDRVRFSGEPVAAVIAVDEDAAAAACELVDVEYERPARGRDPRGGDGGRGARHPRRDPVARARAVSRHRAPPRRGQERLQPLPVAPRRRRSGLRGGGRGLRGRVPDPGPAALQPRAPRRRRGDRARPGDGVDVRGEPVHRPLPGRRDAATARERACASSSRTSAAPTDRRPTRGWSRSWPPCRGAWGGGRSASS